MKMISDEIYFAESNLVHVNKQHIDFLKEKASENKRKRCRLCAHDNEDNLLHEMLIVHSKGNYIRPHKHLNKTESFHIVEGSIRLFFFSDDGQLTDVIRMGEYSDQKFFYYRISNSLYHSMIIESETFVFHETTIGPFNRSDTVFPDWAPEEDDEEGIINFKQRLTAFSV